MKKFTLLTVAALSLIAFTGCSSNNKAQTESKPATTQEAPKAEQSAHKAPDFKWTQAGLDALVVSPLGQNGVGGSNLNDIIASFGEPSNSMDEPPLSGHSFKDVSWTDEASLSDPNAPVSQVALQFEQQDNGDWFLVNKLGNGLK
jgi:hypothetical protein